MNARNSSAPQRVIERTKSGPTGCARIASIALALVAASCSVSAPSVTSADTNAARPAPTVAAEATETIEAAPTPETSPDQPTATASSEPTPPASGPIGALLAAAPGFDRGEGPHERDAQAIFVNDYDAAFAAVGIDIDEVCSSGDAQTYFDAFQELLGPRRIMNQGPHAARLPESFTDMSLDFGFGFCDINAELVTAGMSTAAPMYHVDKAAAEIVSTASANGRYADALSVETINGYTLLDWGDELNVPQATGVRPLGIGGQLIVDPPIVARTVDRATANEVANVNRGRLIDQPFIAETFAYQAREGAYSIFVTDKPLGLSPRLIPPDELLEARDDGTLEQLHERPVDAGLMPWSMLAIGTAEQDGADMPIAVVVLSHVSEERAAENARRLRRSLEEGLISNYTPWAERVELLDINVEGSTVVARVASTDHLSPSITISTAYSTKEPLFAIAPNN